MKKLQAAGCRLLKDIISIRFALLLLLCYGIITQFIFHTVCPFLILTHFPCPGCGLTRAGLMLLQGKYAQAFSYNAMIFLWMPFLIYLIIWRYLFGKKPPFVMPLTIAVCLTTLLYYAHRLMTGQIQSAII